jgi:drug/metabolite transporter (DMT)-like permease
MFVAALAIGAALAFGAADFWGGLAARQVRAIVTTFGSALAAALLLAIVVAVSGGRWSASDVGWGVLAGSASVIGLMLLYASLAIGPMSILSPLTAIVSAITPLAWGLLVNGETFDPIGYVGLGIALVAVLLVGFVPGHRVVRPSGRGLVFAIGAGLGIGAFLITMDRTSTDSEMVPLLVARSTSAVLTGAIVGFMVLAAVRSGQPARSALLVTSPAVSRYSATRLLTLVIVCGLTDGAGNVALLVALHEGDLAVVSALSALYPAGTILLAALVVRERVAVIQWIGLALALAAGGMLSAA